MKGVTIRLTPRDLERAQRHILEWRKDNEAAGGDLKRTQARRYYAVSNISLCLFIDDTDGIIRALNWLDALEAEKAIAG